MSRRFVKQVEIRWRDMDAFLHVNNSVYLTYLEEVRDEWLLRVTEDMGLVEEFVLARVAIDFRSALVQDDDVAEVSLEVVRLGGASLTTRERIVALSDGRLAAEAESVMVRHDRTAGGSRPIDGVLRERLEAWLEAP
jgi:acyl-CoA thioester hydrolase